MAKKSKNRWMGIIIGPVLTLMAMTALWKNENRFDYYRAAARTQAVRFPSEAPAGALISLTGTMDRELTIPGEYVASFTGFLTVWRDAEIYAWERDEDEDDGVTWDLHWMSHVESNSRNSQIRQELSSRRFLPERFRVGELSINSDLIEFVDPRQSIKPQSLTIQRQGLEPDGPYLYLYKHQPSNLGDERVYYSGIPVPSVATYFGKNSMEGAVADTSQQRTGLIDSLIRDTGVLHHLVAGERNVALATMKAHLGRLKWIVRGIGTAVVVLGILLGLSTVFGLLFHIPLIGRIAESGVFVLALVIGLPLAAVTMVSSYLVAHPLVLLAIVVAVTLITLRLRQRGKTEQSTYKHALDQQYGHVLGEDEIKELQFLSLARLARGESGLQKSEEDFLRRWARKHGWNEAKYQEILGQAESSRGEDETESSNDAHLRDLMQLALADGQLTPYEVSSIRRVARRLGYDDRQLRQLTSAIATNPAVWNHHEGLERLEGGV